MGMSYIWAGVLIACAPAVALAQTAQTPDPQPAQPPVAETQPGPAMLNSAATQSAPATKSVFDGNYLTVGGGAFYGPSYEGSKHYVIFAVPVVQGRIAGVTINPRAGGAAFDLIPDAKGAKFGLSLGPVATYSANRDRHVVDPVVIAAGTLNSDIEVGVTGGITMYRLLDKYDSISVSTDVKYDIRGPSDGWEMSPSINYMTPLSKSTLLTIGASAKHVSWGYADYYYSVNPTQSANSGLPQYQARSGWASVGGTMVLARSLAGDLRKGGLSIIAVGGYSKLMNSARYTPYTSIRGSANQLMGGLGLAATF
jgi:MipA family protein